MGCCSGAFYAKRSWDARDFLMVETRYHARSTKLNLYKSSEPFGYSTSGCRSYHCSGPSSNYVYIVRHWASGKSGTFGSKVASTGRLGRVPEFRLVIATNGSFQVPSEDSSSFVGPIKPQPLGMSQLPLFLVIQITFQTPSSEIQVDLPRAESV